MKLEIKQLGNPILRKKCSDIKIINDKVKALVKNMLYTMYDANGVGLAAPQIGVPLNIAIADISHSEEPFSYLKVNGKDTDIKSIMPLVFINPKIELSGDKYIMEEGCLSIKEIKENVTRPDCIKAKITTLDSKEITIETDGLLSRVIQHECDHLNGILFIDRLNSATKVKIRSTVRFLMKQSKN